MRRYALFLGLAIAASTALKPSAAVGHGVDIVVEPAQSLRVRATYDSGEAMANAAVIVYAPDGPTEPWARGTTDAEGYFTFTPDTAIPGDWGIQVRQAGHGNIVSVPVSEEFGILGSGDGAGELVTSSHLGSPLQKGLMIGSVFWGCLGTALFFSTRTRQSN